MFAKIEITGKIVVDTGMHIGGSGEFAAIGAIDSPVIRDVYNNLPVIPGSKEPIYDLDTTQIISRSNDIEKVLRKTKKDMF